MFAFPIYSEIISLIISAQPSHTDPEVEHSSFLGLYSFGVTLSGGRSGCCALVLQPGFVVFAGWLFPPEGMQVSDKPLY